MLNRDLQRRILDALRLPYPRGIYIFDEVKMTEEEAAYNLRYLEGHGLCNSGLLIGADGHFSWQYQTITEAGLDFLEGDGGLSAILGTVTIKLHADTLRVMLETKIANAAISEEEKGQIRKHVAALSETALQAATSDLVQQGLNSLPDAISWLRRFLGL